MSDRTDDKIRAFVAELVNDPPTTPEIDFDDLDRPGWWHRVSLRPAAGGCLPLSLSVRRA